MNLVREHHIAIWHRAQNAITHIWTNCSRRHLRAQTHSRLTWFTICLIITPQNCRIAEFTFAFDAIYFSRHELRVWETLHEWCILYPEIRQMDDNDSNWLTCLIFFNFLYSPCSFTENNYHNSRNIRWNGWKQWEEMGTFRIEYIRSPLYPLCFAVLCIASSESLRFNLTSANCFVGGFFFLRSFLGAHLKSWESTTVDKLILFFEFIVKSFWFVQRSWNSSFGDVHRWS